MATDTEQELIDSLADLQRSFSKAQDELEERLRDVRQQLTEIDALAIDAELPRTAVQTWMLFTESTRERLAEAFKVFSSVPIINLDVDALQPGALLIANLAQTLRASAAGIGIAAPRRTVDRVVLPPDVEDPVSDDAETLDREALRRAVTATRDRALNHLRTSHLMLDPEAASWALGSESATNPRRAASDWRRASKLLGLPVGRSYRYPGFQFDMEARTMHTVVADTNVALDALADPIGVGSWWATPNVILDDRAPMEAIDNPDGIRSAAAALTAPVG